MVHEPTWHHRRSIRLQGYDYASAGAYFVTICTHRRVCLFGDVVEGAMRRNACGEAVASEWERSAEIRTEIEIAEYVVMPNHLHGIVIHHGAQHRAGRPLGPSGAPPATIGALVAGFKAAATKRVICIPGTPGAPVWQRGYYEHVIRDDADYRRVAAYIAANPRRWSTGSHP